MESGELYLAVQVYCISGSGQVQITRVSFRVGWRNPKQPQFFEGNIFFHNFQIAQIKQIGLALRSLRNKIFFLTIFYVQLLPSSL